MLQIPAKTYNKQEFPTEMVANVPWTISPMTENVEQNSVPNYVNAIAAATIFFSALLELPLGVEVTFSDVFHRVLTMSV